jgi:hypothetical protein
MIPSIPSDISIPIITILSGMNRVGRSGFRSVTDTHTGVAMDITDGRITAILITHTGVHRIITDTIPTATILTIIITTVITITVIRIMAVILIILIIITTITGLVIMVLDGLSKITGLQVQAPTMAAVRLAVLQQACPLQPAEEQWELRHR